MSLFLVRSKDVEPGHIISRYGALADSEAYELVRYLILEKYHANETQFYFLCISLYVHRDWEALTHQHQGERGYITSPEIDEAPEYYFLLCSS